MKEITLDVDAATFLPLDLEVLKQDLRITHDDLDEVLTGQYIPAALAWAEGVTRRAIALRAHRWIIDEFPCGEDQTIYLPRGRVTGVTSIAYSSGGSITTLRGPTSGSPAGTQYQEDLRGHQARVMPLRGQSWPGVDSDVPSPIVVTFTAGWALADIPADLKRAMTAHVADAMDLPGSESFNVNTRDIDFPTKLISSYMIRV